MSVCLDDTVISIIDEKSNRFSPIKKARRAFAQSKDGVLFPFRNAQTSLFRERVFDFAFARFRVFHAEQKGIFVNKNRLLIRMLWRGHAYLGMTGGKLTEKQIEKTIKFTDEVLCL